MATRMQQRRGTAAQWTLADPILAAGEIGFESDTGQFKIGDGVNHWDDISYFKNLEDLGGSLDDYVPVDTKGQANGVASLDSSGKIPVGQLGNLIAGAPDALNTLKELADAISNDGTFASTMVNALSGKLSLGGGTMTGNINMSGNTILDVLVSAPTVNSNPVTKAYADSGISTHAAISTNVHGVADMAALATTAATTSAISTHNSRTTDVHGIADTAALATTAATASAISTSVSNHNALTANVHGISDTSLLALKSEVAAVTATTLGLGNVDNTADTAKPVSTAQSAAIATAKAEAISDATARVTAVIASAPGALDTLDELAAALGDDANFASSVTTSLGLKVDSLTPISQKSASYTLSSLTERDDLIEMGSGSAMTLTIPADATLNFPIGTSLDVLQTSTGQVTIAGAGGVTVNATPGLKLRTQWSSVTLFKRAANTWVAYGDLMA